MPMNPDSSTTGPVVRFDKSELRARLDPLTYQVTQEKGTEKPITNKYYKHFEPGTYSCVVCGEDLFLSNTKYDSGSGWPAFYDVMDANKVTFRPDASAVGANLLRIVANPHLIRTEVNCRHCGSHLGHIFDDGPPPTGKRYCINSSSLDFKADPDAPDGQKEPPKILKFQARINGCGANGVCMLKKKSPTSSPFGSRKIILADSIVKKRIDDKETAIKKEKSPSPSSSSSETKSSTDAQSHESPENVTKVCVTSRISKTPSPEKDTGTNL